MNHEEFTKSIIEHFLGNNWYSQMWNTSDILDDAYDTIKGKYKSKYIINDILRYRLNHPKCKYCKYCKYVCAINVVGVSGYYECKVKDKIINFINFPRNFCKYRCIQIPKDDV